MYKKIKDTIKAIISIAIKINEKVEKYFGINSMAFFIMPKSEPVSGVPLNVSKTLLPIAKRIHEIEASQI